jgi:hypothetical protein
VPASWSHDKPPASIRRNRRRFLLGFVLLGFVLALALVKGATAAPTGWGGCWFACKERHPIRSQYPHGVCRTIACEAKKDRQHDRTPTVRTRSNSVYPCVHRWVYHGTPYWHLHYADGGKGRAHPGSTTSYRRCI